MKQIIITLILCIASILSAQDTTRQAKHTYHIGSELDIFPFATGGYYASAIAGWNTIQFRLVAAKSNLPKFILPSGFDKNTNTVFAVIVDYFPFDTTNKGLWIGAGLESWNNHVHTTGSKASSTFTNHIATVGAGYLLYIGRYLYINPWGALHAVISGPKNVSVANKNYPVPALLPELSVKAGVKIPL